MANQFDELKNKIEETNRLFSELANKVDKTIKTLSSHRHSGYDGSQVLKEDLFLSGASFLRVADLFLYGTTTQTVAGRNSFIKSELPEKTGYTGANGFILVNPKNLADATLSGTPRLIEVSIAGVPYYLKIYPTKT